MLRSEGSKKRLRLTEFLSFNREGRRKGTSENHEPDALKETKYSESQHTVALICVPTFWGSLWFQPNYKAQGSVSSEASSSSFHRTEQIPTTHG